MRYDKLTITSLDEEGHKRTCGYWYVVQSHHLPHTAFATRESLVSWLSDLGLQAAKEIPERGTFGAIQVIGAYNRVALMSTDLPTGGVITERRTLDNAQYTRGVITEANGERTLWVSNCNVPNRPVFDYRESRAMVG